MTRSIGPLGIGRREDALFEHLRHDFEEPLVDHIIVIRARCLESFQSGIECLCWLNHAIHIDKSRILPHVELNPHGIFRELP